MPEYNFLMAVNVKAIGLKKAKKRKHVRFPSDVGAQAYILTDNDNKKLKIPLPALVVEESFKGCSLVALKNSIFYEGAQFKVKVGRLDVMSAEVRWVKSFDGKICFMGLVYFD